MCIDHELADTKCDCADARKLRIKSVELFIQMLFVCIFEHRVCHPASLNTTKNEQTNSGGD